MKFSESTHVEKMKEISSLMYLHGWNESNAGNISCLITQDEIELYEDLNLSPRIIDLKYNLSQASGMVFLVTGSGKRLKDIKNDPKNNIGIVRIEEDGNRLQVLWGFEDGAQPTSEFPSHVHSHLSRLAVDKNHRVVLHCHPVHVIAMTFVHELDDREFTLSLWKTITECVLIFNDGVGVLPWMSAGSLEVAEETAKKFKETRTVIWGQHGVFVCEHNLEDAFGLMETVEKGAQIYMNIFGKTVLNKISKKQLKEVCEIYKIKPKEGYLD